MITYVTKVEIKSTVNFIVCINGKNETVTKAGVGTNSAHLSFRGAYIFDDFTIQANRSHLSELVLAIEVAKVIKENNIGD
ncbi:MAG: hypothetical protein HRT95_10650 [Moritella sp.]|uniref:hypothetical protein n=1 Tax=Moritella sp. TaxID=78556 RepID=UPI001D8098FA|nr:hypothetical protein [Moritella sp.]NQZ50608.1 hypothetical protein [Moritella sp.]